MFNALAIAVGLLQVISVTPAPSGNGTTPNLKCAQVTQSECTWNKSPIYSPYGADSITQCQTQCKGQAGCSIFTWDRESKQCSLYPADAIQTCKRIGKPKSPAECSADPCAEFQNQECTMDGNMLDHFPSVISVDMCAKICQSGVNGCEYFEYGANSDKKECEIRSEATFHCTVFKGSAKATYNKAC